nr:DUF167 domain-containing protein [Ramlibacter aurantiacus]
MQVRVKPNARASLLTPPSRDGEPWLVQVAAPPVDGKANDELVRLLASHFGCNRSAVKVKTGAGARLKLVEIDGDG